MATARVIVSHGLLHPCFPKNAQRWGVVPIGPRSFSPGHSGFLGQIPTLYAGPVTAPLLQAIGLGASTDLLGNRHESRSAQQLLSIVSPGPLGRAVEEFRGRYGEREANTRRQKAGGRAFVTERHVADPERRVHCSDLWVRS
jgi:hypothetical protein